MGNPISTERIQQVIIELRDQKVLLDSDVARIYGVATKRINEAVRNNPEKFPDDYLIQLTQEEWDALKSKFSTSKRGGKIKLPSAFPEKGLYMLATILKSPQATKATFAIIETFAKIRELSATIKALSVVKDEGEQKSLMQRSGEIISEVFDEELRTSGTETSIELNFAVLKFKHTVKRNKGCPPPSRTNPDRSGLRVTDPRSAVHHVRPAAQPALLPLPLGCAPATQSG